MTWLKRLEAEHDNLRAAQEWSLSAGEPAEAALRLAFALWHFWNAHDYYSEGKERVRAVLERCDGASPALRARVLDVAGCMVWPLGEIAEARSLFEESLALSRELEQKEAAAISLHHLGNLVASYEDRVLGRSLLEQSVTTLRQLDCQAELAWAISDLGDLFVGQGDDAAARSLYEESLGIFRKLGNKYGLAFASTRLGEWFWRQHDFPAARSLLEEGLSVSREVGSKSRLAYSLRSLGRLALDQGDHAAAREFFAESLACRGEAVFTFDVAENLEGLAKLAAEEGQTARAARLLGAAEAHRRPGAAPILSFEQAGASLGLSDELFAAAWAEGRAMTLQQAIRVALDPYFAVQR